MSSEKCWKACAKVASKSTLFCSSAESSASRRRVTESANVRDHVSARGPPPSSRRV
jgi:hypothetical protein